MLDGYRTTKRVKQAIFKWNNGKGALLCSECGVIIKVGKDYTNDEWLAMRGEIELKPQYCKDHNKKIR